MQKLMKWAALIGGIFIVAALSFVIYLGQNRVVVIVDSGTGIGAPGFSGKEGIRELPGYTVELQKSEDGENSFWIPVETTIGPENITVENRYANRQLIISLRGAAGSFYKSSKVTGNTALIREASCDVYEEGVALYLQFSEMYECESIFKAGYLQFRLTKPSEQYERIVILDAELPDHMDSQAEETLHQIETKLSERLKEEGIRAYSTYSQGEELSTEEKATLASETGADMYLGLTLAYDQDKEQFGTYACYNGIYFMPKLTNGVLADTMERELVTEIGGKAKGLVDTDEGVLGKLSVPAVMICPGYMSHDTEGRLLQQDAYQDKIAEGICQGVLKAYEKLEN